MSTGPRPVGQTRSQESRVIVHALVADELEQVTSFFSALVPSPVELAGLGGTRGLSQFWESLWLGPQTLQGLDEAI